MATTTLVELPECMDCGKIDYRQIGKARYKGKVRVLIICQICGREYLLGATLNPIKGTGARSQGVM